MQELKPRIFLEKPPISFYIAKVLARLLIQYQMHGSRKIFQFLDLFGLFDRRVAKFQLANKYSLFIPLYRPERWDRKDIINYEASLLSELVSTAACFQGKVTIVDCGADIGLISISLADQLENVDQIIAFEPNHESFIVLQKTLAELPIKSQVFQVGVSDFSGLGALQMAPYNASQHAQFVVQVERDGFPVMTIDSFMFDIDYLLMKIDVEGGELGVIRGAANTIKSSKGALLSIEAHPDVFSRTGIDPILLLRELISIRNFSFKIAEEPAVQLDISRPFFDQFPDDGTVYNVVCIAE